MEVVYFQSFIGRMDDKARYYHYTTLHESQERELFEIKIGHNIGRQRKSWSHMLGRITACSLISMVEYGEGTRGGKAWKRQTAPWNYSSSLVSNPLPLSSVAVGLHKDCTLIFLRIKSLPASSESPLSSAVVAKPKDRDDGGRRADLLMEKDDDW